MNKLLSRWKHIFLMYIYIYIRTYISLPVYIFPRKCVIAMCLSYPNHVQHINAISNIGSSLRASQCRVIRPTDLSNMIYIVFIDSFNNPNLISKPAHLWKVHAIDGFQDKMVNSFRRALWMHDLDWKFRASLWMCRHHLVVCSGVSLFHFWLGQNLFRGAHIHSILTIENSRDCWWIASKIVCEEIVWNNWMNLNKCV